MNFGSVNWWAIVTCVAASMVIGAVWFGPKTFFPIWWKAIGKSDGDDPGDSTIGMSLTWGLIIFSSFVQAVFMSVFVDFLGNLSGGTSLLSGAMAGFLLWLGFVAPSSLTNKLFADRLKAWALEAGNHLVTFVVMGAIAGAWR
ncbi:MAG: DUF1761 domain-containing protein [Chloroflexi bacterium]|nr:DUF1761 domain-containing protein [Chloroflexota bacterium]